MPTGFQIFYVEKFPSFEKNTVSTSTQLLIVDPKGNDNKSDKHSKITKTNQIVLDYEKFLIYHETDKKLRYRLHERIFNHLIEIHEFNAYYSSSYKRLIIQAPKELACDAIRTFKREKILIAEQKEIDYKLVLERAKNVFGNWFGNLPPGRVKTIAIFGDHVDLSNQYSELIEAGAKLKFVILELKINGKLYKIGISKNRGITFYEKLDLLEELELINNIHTWFEEKG